MEQQCSPLLSWSYNYYEEEGIEELKHSLLYSTLELEASILSAHEEISRKDDEILNLKGLLSTTIKERDEYQAKSQTLVLQNQLLFQQIQAQSSKKHVECALSSGTTSNEDENVSLSPSDCESPGKDSVSLPEFDIIDNISIKKARPKNGKFLQAVMEAGPLLQTLLLAGPLPQWQHPPPQLNSIDIPPVTISSPTLSNKRAMIMNSEGSDFSPKSKCQKVVHQSSLKQLLLSP